MKRINEQVVVHNPIILPSKDEILSGDIPIHQGRMYQRADAQYHCRLHEGIYAITDDE